MILHLAMFTWNDRVTAEQVGGLTADLNAMAAQIDAIVEYACGPNLAITPSTADFVVAAAVIDADGLAAYLADPLHRAVQERWLDHMVSARLAAQLPMPFATQT
jgi:hypothetical protein